MKAKSFVYMFFFIMLSRPLSSQTGAVQLVTFDYPPYMTSSDGIARGMNVEIVTEAFRRIGLPIRIQFYPVSRCLNMIEKKEAHGMFSLKKTPEREKTMVFPSEPLLTQEYMIFKQASSSFVFDGSISSLSALTVGIVDNTSYGPIFDNAVRDGLVSKRDSSTSFELTMKKLAAGRMDAVICSRVVGYSILQKLGYLDSIISTGPPLETVHSYISFIKTPDGESLAVLFDSAITDMRRDGTLESITAGYE